MILLSAVTQFVKANQIILQYERFILREGYICHSVMLCIMLCCVKLLHPSVGGDRDPDPDRQSLEGLIVIRYDSDQPNEVQINLGRDVWHIKKYFYGLKVNCPERKKT